LPDKTMCKNGGVYFEDKQTQRFVSTARDPDGALHADGVLPGTYHVTVNCQGYQAKPKYAAIDIRDKDITGLVWEVDAGARLRGKVASKSGMPVEHAMVTIRTIGGAARARTDWQYVLTTNNGQYEISGLLAGTFKVEVNHDKLNEPKDGWK